ncbi:hypothetical protein [Streptomyces xanthophaeus]
MTDRRLEDRQEPDEDIDEKERTRRAGLNPVRSGTASSTRGESEPDERPGKEEKDRPHHHQADEDG